LVSLISDSSALFFNQNLEIRNRPATMSLGNTIFSFVISLEMTVSFSFPLSMLQDLISWSQILILTFAQNNRGFFVLLIECHSLEN
jgi:hypothetical protein